MTNTSQNNELAVIQAEYEIIEQSEITISSLIDQWINTVLAKENTGTAKTYIKNIRLHKEWLEDHNIKQMPTKDNLRDWLSSIQDKSISTQRVRLSTAKQFYLWLSDEYQRLENPSLNLKIRGKQSKAFKKGSLTADQAKRMLDSVDITALTGKRDLAMLRLMTVCGLRCIEVSRLQIKDLVNINGVRMLNLRGKGYAGDISRSIVIPETVDQVITSWLNAYPVEFDQNSPLFCSFSNRNSGKALTTTRISQIAKYHIIEAAGKCKELTAHSLRHTAATLAILNGADHLEVQKNLGHSDFNTTLIYVNQINSTKNKANYLVDNLI